MKSNLIKIVSIKCLFVLQVSCRLVSAPFLFKMKLFIFVLFALFAIAFARPNDGLKKVAEVGTSVVTVPGGFVTGL